MDFPSPKPILQRLGTAIRTQRVAREFGIETLSRLLGEYLPEEQIGEVRRAYQFGAALHEGQSRTSGEPYIFHPLAVARILAEMRLDHTTLIAAILHDVIEDTDVSRAEIEQQFGKEVAQIVDGVSKIEKIEGMSRAERQAESFRKLVLAMTQDLRVILVKLADRLHNMRTLGAMAPDKKKRIAEETLDIYGPIAQRLGITTLRRELEDLAFAALHPHRHEVFVKVINEALGDAKGLIREVESRLSKALAEEGIGATVVGRQKSIYSLYNKMRAKRLKFLDVMDLLGFRIITAKLDECYRALGVVHHVFRPVPGLFDDYIANPRGNGYQSLHTTCVGPEGKKIEVQIRTREMHHTAESGIAAHWQYKQGGKEGIAAPQARAREWLKSMLDAPGQKEASDFVEHVKVDLFPDEVYVFTPKGEIRRLPKGATPVDFAYAVHTELGDRTVAARVEGHLEPLNTPLKSGQTVEIITSKHARPNAAWLNYVKTAKARARIRNFLKDQREDEAIRLGRRLLEIALRELKVPAGVLASPTTVAPVLKSYHLEEIEDLYASIGSGTRLAPLVARHFLPELVAGSPHTASTTTGGTLAVEGTEGLIVDYGRCCRPVPGDDIIGAVSASRGLVIHRLECEHVKQSKSSDRIAMVWSPKVQGDFFAEIIVKALNQRGLLASVAGQIAEAGSSIENVQMPEGVVAGEAFETRYLITVKDRVQLAQVIKRVRRIGPVERVLRL